MIAIHYYFLCSHALYPKSKYIQNILICLIEDGNLTTTFHNLHTDPHTFCNNQRHGMIVI